MAATLEGIARVPDILSTMRHKIKRALQDAREGKAPLDSFVAEAVESSLYHASQILAATAVEHCQATRSFIRELNDMRLCVKQAVNDDPSILTFLSSEKLGHHIFHDPFPVVEQVNPSEVGTSSVKRMSHSRSRPASIHTDMMNFFGSTEACPSDPSDCASGQAQWPESDDLSDIPHSIAVASLLIAETSRHAAFAKHLINAHLETGRFQQTLSKWQNALQTMHCETRRSDSHFLCTATETVERLQHILLQRVWPSLQFLSAKVCSVDPENPWPEAMKALANTMAHFATLAHISRESHFSALLCQKLRLINTDVKMIQLQTRCHKCQSINGAFKLRCCQVHICPACMHAMMRSEFSREVEVARICSSCGSVETGGKHPIVQANLLAQLAHCMLQHAKILKGPINRGDETCGGLLLYKENSLSTRAGTSTEDVVASVINDALSGTQD